jgi:hypothetical protein
MRLVLGLLSILTASCTSRLYTLAPVDLVALQGTRLEAERLVARHAPDGHAAAIISVERVIEHELMPASGHWTMHATLVRRYVVIDPHNQTASTFSFTTEEDEELVQAELVVLPPRGEPRRYSRDLLVRQSRGDGRVSYKFAYPAVTRGTIIEERIETNFGDQRKNARLTFTIPLQHRWPCQRARAVFAYPAKWGVQVRKDASGQRLKYEVSERHGQRVISCERSDLPALQPERFAPYDLEDGVHLRLAMTLIEVSHGHYYSPVDWKAFGKKMCKHVVDNDSIFSRSVGTTALAVAGGIVDPLKKLEAVVAHVQRTIRLDDRYEAKDFPTVLKTRRGSALQIVGLAHRMLRKLGLDVEYVIIHSAKDGPFDESFIHYGELKVPAVLAKIAGKSYLALPQYKWLAIGVIPPELQGRPAVRIDDSGFAGFYTTPVLDASASRAEETLSLTIAPSGVVSVRGERVLHGSDAYEARRRWARLTPEELIRKVKVQRPHEVTDWHLEVVDLKVAEKPLIIRFSYTAGSQVSLSGSEAVLQTAGLLAPKSVAARPRRRLRAVSVHASGSFARHVELRFPSSWTLQTKLRGKERSNSFGEAHLRYDVRDGELRVDQTVVLRRQKQSASAYNDLLSLTRVGQRLRVPALVFNVGPTAMEVDASRAEQRVFSH